MCVNLLTDLFVHFRRLLEFVFEAGDFLSMLHVKTIREKARMGVTDLFESSRQCLQPIPLRCFFFSHAIVLLLHPIILILQLVDLLTKLVDRLLQTLQFSILLVALFFEVSKGCLKLRMLVVGVGLQFGDIHTKILALSLTLCQHLRNSSTGVDAQKCEMDVHHGAPRLDLLLPQLRLSTHPRQLRRSVDAR